MITKTFKDGSIAEHYEAGDLVEVTKKQYMSSSCNANVGEWGRVVLINKDDRDRGHTSLISHIGIQTAGVSTPEHSFKRCIASIPVWDVKARPETINHSDSNRTNT